MQPGEELCGFSLFQHIALGNFQHNLEMVCGQGSEQFLDIRFKAFAVQVGRRNVNAKFDAYRQYFF